MSARHLKYLMIEHNNADVEIALHDFKANGLQSNLHVAKNAAQALDFLLEKDGTLRDDPPHAIFLDIHLPKTEDGLGILRKIKSNELTQGIPVLVLTCSTHPNNVEECKSLGVSIFIEKPLLFDNFIEAIGNIDK